MKTQPANFRTNERSQTLQRCYLYRFDYDGTSYYWARYDTDLSVTGGPGDKMADPQVFTAALVQHSNTDESTDSAPSGVTVSLTVADPELKKLFVTVAPTQEITVEIWRVSSAALPGSLAYDDDLYLIFKGVVDAVGFQGNVVTARCSTPLLQEDRQVPDFYYQKTCNHMLYDQTPGTCMVNPALFSLSTSVNALNRPNLSIDITQTAINVGSPSRSETITEETFLGGTVQDDDGNIMPVMAAEVLPASAGTRLFLAWMPRTLAASDNVTLLCGCLRIKRVCHEFFRNLPNFGGTPYIPTHNPALDGAQT